MEKVKDMFRLNTVRKKVFFLSKLTGGVIILFYIFASELPASKEAAFIIWLLLLVAVIMGVDVLLKHFISTPLTDINNSAEQMAQLDFTAHCTVSTNDEFGALSQNLNSMFLNLQDTLRQLETANKRLEQDNFQKQVLLAERKELVDSLSHEMKTPLGIVRAYVEGLKDASDEQKRAQYMDAILSAADSMNTLITVLLDLSALEAGAARLTEETFDFVELVETTAGRLFADIPNTNYSFSFTLPDEECYIFADRHRIEQVLNNFIVNAQNHVCPKGNIHLTVTYQTNYVLFSIYNEGAAISPSDISNVWSRFYRGENAKNSMRKGSGLGLSIASQILSIYHAEYGCRNESNGVIFYFKFPLSS